jgi:nicotinate-nucleotide adenylyltransferase
VSRLEEGDRKSYSIETVERVLTTGEHPYFIIGADAFAEIASWHRWQELLRLTEFIVVTRPGHAYTAPPGAKVCRLDTVALPVSSSEIRRRLATGEIPSELPPAVARYITEKGLYRK